MKTKTINLYSFDELSEESQQKAIENLYDINTSFEWWESTYEDAERIGLKITGFDLGRNRHATGHIETSELECAEAIMKEHGKECDTFKMAETFLKNWAELVAKYSDGQDLERVSQENESDFDNEAEELEKEFLRELLEDYSIILEKDYEYLTSEEAIIETIKANEYDFLENGKPA